MCTTEKSYVSLIPQFNSSTGDVEKIVFHSVFMAGLTNLVQDGMEVLPEEVDSENVYNIVLKLATDSGKPKLIADTPIVHTFTMTPSEMTAAGIDQETKIKITLKLDGDPVPNIYWIYHDCFSYVVWGRVVVACWKTWVSELIPPAP